MEWMYLNLRYPLLARTTWSIFPAARYFSSQIARWAGQLQPFKPLSSMASSHASLYTPWLKNTNIWDDVKNQLFWANKLPNTIFTIGVFQWFKRFVSRGHPLIFSTDFMGKPHGLDTAGVLPLHRAATAAAAARLRRLQWPCAPPGVKAGAIFGNDIFLKEKKIKGETPVFWWLFFFFKVKLLKRQSLFRENANFSMGHLGIWVSTDRARREKWRARCNL